MDDCTIIERLGRIANGGIAIVFLVDEEVWTDVAGVVGEGVDLLKPEIDRRREERAWTYFKDGERRVKQSEADVAAFETEPSYE